MEELAGIVVMVGPALVRPIWQEFVLEGTLLSASTFVPCFCVLQRGQIRGFSYTTG